MKIIKTLKFSEANAFITEVNCRLHLENIEILQQNHIPTQRDIPEAEREVHVEWYFININREQHDFIQNLFQSI